MTGKDNDDIRADDAQAPDNQAPDAQAPDLWHDDPLLAALSSHDPGDGSTTDLDRVRALADAKIAQTSDGAVITSIQVRRQTWMKPWMAVAAVSVGALVVGAGGYGLGLAHHQSSTDKAATGAASFEPAVTPGGSAGELGANAADSVVSASSGASGSRADEAPSSTAPSAVPSTARTTAQSAQADAWMTGRFNFANGGLSTQTTTAPGWAVDATEVYSANTVTEIAKVFGVTGAAKETSDSWSNWSVSNSKNLGPSVSLDMSGNVSFSDDTTEQESQSKRDKTRMISKAAAIKKVTQTLADLGFEAANWSVASADDTEQWAAVDRVSSTKDVYRSVTASEILEGKASGRTWEFTFFGNDLQWASGSVAPAISLGTYSVISPAQALLRLSDSRFSSNARPTAYPKAVQKIWDSGQVMAGQGDGSTVPPTPSVGAKVDWPVVDVTLTSARLGLSVYTQSDGATLMMPTYELSTADGGTWSVLAVADDALNTEP